MTKDEVIEKMSEPIGDAEGVMTPGTLVIISNPSIYYECFRGEYALVISFQETHVDLLLERTGLGYRCIRVEPQSVRKEKRVA